jgi:hypothetical protein
MIGTRNLHQMDKNILEFFYILFNICNICFNSSPLYVSPECVGCETFTGKNSDLHFHRFNRAVYVSKMQ